ncbi:MAG: hypothetical protein AAF532_02185 [Planctomycetota bacterium]
MSVKRFPSKGWTITLPLGGSDVVIGGLKSLTFAESGPRTNESVMIDAAASEFIAKDPDGHIAVGDATGEVYCDPTPGGTLPLLIAQLSIPPDGATGSAAHVNGLTLDFPVKAIRTGLAAPAGDQLAIPFTIVIDSLTIAYTAPT